VARGPGRLEAVHDAIIGSARAGEPDRYLAALLAPRAERADLLALAAFAAELARVGTQVRREPAMAAMRWQWWREAIELSAGARTGHPIADHVRALKARHGIAPAALIGLVDAHAHDLEPQPFADDAELDRHFVASEGVLFQLSAHVLGLAGNGSAPAWSQWAGRAYGMARLLFGFRAQLARGRCHIPRARLAAAGLDLDVLGRGQGSAGLVALLAELGRQARACLARARHDVTKLPREASIAVLPLALVSTYVRASERAEGSSPPRVALIAPLTRVLRIAGAHWFGRW
jgi:15-cis-phytoene synthase